MLQQSPNRRVVLLIDDPPAPRDREDAAKLAAARNLPREISTLLGEPRRQFDRALADFMRRQAHESIQPQQEIRRLATLLLERLQEALVPVGLRSSLGAITPLVTIIDLRFLLLSPLWDQG